MHITWTDLADGQFDRLHGQRIEIDGWLAFADPDDADAPPILTEEPLCCAGCLPRDPARAIIVHADTPAVPSAAPLRVSGILQLQFADGALQSCELHAARIRPAGITTIAPGFTRRDVLAGISLAAELARIRG